MAPELERVLRRDRLGAGRHDRAAIRRELVWVTMRDGVRLATDVYLPPVLPAPAVALRTPYGRATDADFFATAATHGYVGIAQDCRGTGDSEPDSWDFFIYEIEDSSDFIDWVIEQDWFSGFVGSVGGSYTSGTQFCMGMHPAMSALTPEVGGLGAVPITRPSYYMFVNAYSRSVGHSAEYADLGYEEMERRMLPETLAGGYFNEPLFRPLSDSLVGRYPELATMVPEEAQRR
ncbi:MAG TPA: CocE/NonD family hydrolase, partial [Solirubrobacterales bacterium]|nr:CocE/NonD family hydrolase [Solirubrobacterales bacterium]